MRRIGRRWLLALVLAAATAGAQPYGRPWHELSPDEQQRAWENYQRYQRLPEQRRRSMEERYRQFRAMPPEQQQRLRQNYDRYRELPPGERHEFVEKYRRWKGKR